MFTSLAKYSLEDKQNTVKKGLFKNKLADYLKIKKQFLYLLQVWFWDKSGFSLIVIRRKNWCKNGTRSNKRGERQKGRINVMGGVRYQGKRIQFGKNNQRLKALIYRLNLIRLSPAYSHQ